MHIAEMNDSQRRVLLIDDNPSIHEDFRKILMPYRIESDIESTEAELFGSNETETVSSEFEIDSAYQGQEGLTLAEQAKEEGRPYSLAFVDVRMPPGWDGVETIQRIWERCPELQVVICTAYSDYSWDAIVKQLGRSDSLLILKKPFDSVEVLQLAHALTRKYVVTEQANIRMEDLDRLVQQRTAELTAANARLQREVEQRAAAQEELRLSEERFSKAFRSTPIPLAILRRREGTLADANESFLEFSALSREASIGERLDNLHLWHSPEVWAGFMRHLDQGKRVRHEPTETVRPDGEHRLALVSLEPLQVGGEACLLIIAQDITEQKRLEGQLLQSQKMEAVGQLAAGVAHDFNNLLTIIQGHAGLHLANETLDLEVIRSLREVSLAADRASSLTRQLLAFSRKQVSDAKVLDLRKVIFQLETMLRRLLSENIEFQCTCPASLPSIVGDATGIEQILMNLVINARDAQVNGGQITLTAEEARLDSADAQRHRQARPGRFVCLSVVDAGCGIPKETLSRIYEPFFTTKDVGKGTGLGLSTVYAVVKQHRGWLEVTSEVGQGTTFRVFLPVAVPTRSDSSHTTLFVKRQEETRGHETLLLVEDETALRSMAAQALSRQGYVVLEAEDGQQALEVWEQVGREIDLLLTDLVMPGRPGGVELAQRLLAQKRSLRTLFSSGYSTDLMREDVHIIEGVNFLQKPYKISQLLESVRRCLDTVEVPQGTVLPKDYEPVADFTRPGAQRPGRTHPVSDEGLLERAPGSCAEVQKSEASLQPD